MLEPPTHSADARAAQMRGMGAAFFAHREFAFPKVGTALGQRRLVSITDLLSGFKNLARLEPEEATTWLAQVARGTAFPAGNMLVSALLEMGADPNAPSLIPGRTCLVDWILSGKGSTPTSESLHSAWDRAGADWWQPAESGIDLVDALMDQTPSFDGTVLVSRGKPPADAVARAVQEVQEVLTVRTLVLVFQSMLQSDRVYGGMEERQIQRGLGVLQRAEADTTHFGGDTLQKLVSLKNRMQAFLVRLHAERLQERLPDGPERHERKLRF